VKLVTSRFRGSASLGLVGLSIAAFIPTLALAGEPEPSDPIAAEIRKSLEQDSGPSEPINWDALNWDPWSLTTPSKQSALNAPKDPLDSSTNWDRKVNPDGSTALTAKKRLPTALDANVGLDLGVAPGGPDDPAAGRMANGSTPANTGAAWANVNVSGASIDARLDPSQDQAKLGTTLKKSVPVNDTVSVSLENGYAVTDTYATGSAATWGVPPGAGTPSRIYSTDGIAKMTIEPTGTTFSTGTRLTSTDDKWRKSLGAEQKLFGGFNVSGSVSETDTGAIDRALSAGFKKTW